MLTCSRKDVGYGLLFKTEKCYKKMIYPSAFIYTCFYALSAMNLDHKIGF